MGVSVVAKLLIGDGGHTLSRPVRVVPAANDRDDFVPASFASPLSPPSPQSICKSSVKPPPDYPTLVYPKVVQSGKFETPGMYLIWTANGGAEKAHWSLQVD